MWTRRWFIILTAAAVVTLALACQLVGQMSRDELQQLLKEQVAVRQGELPYVEKVYMGPGVLANSGASHLSQRLRFRREGPMGYFPADMYIDVAVLSDEKQAYRQAVRFAETQFALPGTPGLPEGTHSGFPVGQKSWVYGPPDGAKPGPGQGTSVLVVYDGSAALRVDIRYQPIDPKAKTAVFMPVSGEDRERSEYVARLLLSRVQMLLMNWDGSNVLRIHSGRATLPARKTSKGLYIPAGSALRQYGGVVKRSRTGVFTVEWGGKRVTVPVAARVLLTGKQQIPLSTPVLYDGQEIWIEAQGFAQALGWKLVKQAGAISLSL